MALQGRQRKLAGGAVWQAFTCQTRHLFASPALLPSHRLHLFTFPPFRIFTVAPAGKRNGMVDAITIATAIPGWAYELGMVVSVIVFQGAGNVWLST